MSNSSRSDFLIVPARLVFMMWVAFSIQYFLGIDLGFLGINPRTTSGLIGILTGPLIHGNFQHILSNSLPVLFLGSTLYFFYPRLAKSVFLQCYFFTNFFVWLFARPSYHIGASGLVYALAFFLISLGIFKRDLKTIFISIVIVGVYGGLLYGVFTFTSGVSWESHLLGAIVGIGSAFTIVKFNQEV